MFYVFFYFRAMLFYVRVYDALVYCAVMLLFSQVISLALSALIFFVLKSIKTFFHKKDIFEYAYPVVSAISWGLGFTTFVIVMDRIFINQKFLSVLHISELVRLAAEIGLGVLIVGGSVFRAVKQARTPRDAGQADGAGQDDTSVGRRMFMASAASAVAVATISADIARKKGFALEVKEPKTPSRNVLLVTFDALTAEDMSTYGYYLGTTPNIDAFAKSADVYNNFYACSTFTTPGIAAILTGRYPSQTQTYQLGSMLYGENVYRTLPAILKTEGYRTGSVFANPYAMRLMGTTHGAFDRIVCPSQIGMGQFPPPEILATPGIPDVMDLNMRLLTVTGLAVPGLRQRETLEPPTETFAAAKAMLSELKEPFFVWIHVMAPHAPYLPSEGFRYSFLAPGQFDSRQDMLHPQVMERSKGAVKIKDDIAKVRLRYDEWILQADSAFGDFMAFMDSSGLSANTVTMVSADHGEVFDQGNFGHGGDEFHRSLIHIPMILKTPGQTTGRRINTVADQTSIAPTVLDFAGLPKPAWMAGLSLRAVAAEPAAQAPAGLAINQYFERNSSFKPVTTGKLGAISDGFQYVRDLDSGKESLYPLESGIGAAVEHEVGGDMRLVLEKIRHSLQEKLPEITL